MSHECQSNVPFHFELALFVIDLVVLPQLKTIPQPSLFVFFSHHKLYPHWFPQRKKKETLPNHVHVYSHEKKERPLIGDPTNHVPYHVHIVSQEKKKDSLIVVLSLRSMCRLLSR